MKSKKSVLKITPIIYTVNILVLLAILVFYVARGVHYYLEENGKKVGSDIVYFGDYITKKQSRLDETKGLVYDKEKNIYVYKGDIDDNYLYYSGIMYRILGIDNENNVRAVADKNVTIMYSGLNRGYEKSYVRTWLNIIEDENHSGIYMNNFYDYESILAHSYVCNDVIDDVNSITCENNTNNDYVSILSLNDYSIAGGKESFLNNGENFYLATINSENNNYVVSNTGDIILNNIYTRAYGVRPVITIDASVNLLAGDGSSKNPYIIEKHDINSLSDVYVGDIVKISGSNYKVISIGENVFVAGVESIKDGEDEVLKSFGESNKYSTSGSAGKYLNNDFYESLSDKDLIVKSNYYVGNNSMSDLSYTLKYDSKVSAKVGMLSLGDLFIHEVGGVFTISRSIESDDVIEVINNEGNLFGDFVSSKYALRPAFYLNGNAIIESGKGTNDNPYVLGGIEDEEETKEE
ncbi:MAG: hypothetical protein IJB83_01870 [Bacilli bacterium]|nr:hypothetical protein [Bacilli bacterium]